MNLGIHYKINYIKSKFKTKPMSEERVRMKFLSVVYRARSRVKKSMNAKKSHIFH